MSILSLAFISSGAVWAQDKADEGGDTTGLNVRYEASGHLGVLLPNQIRGVTEIMGLGGLRGGMRIGKGMFAEGGLITGNGEGVEWKNIHTSVRMDIPVENLVGIAYFGPDMYLYQGVNTSRRMIFGGHVGGGMMALLGGATWFRADMKFGFSPGTSLYFGFGFMFRFDGGGGSGGGGS